MSRQQALDAAARRHGDWRQKLDARITRCPGCDEWVWDGRCSRCDGHSDSEEAA